MCADVSLGTGVVRTAYCVKRWKKLFTRTANVLPPSLKWRHVKMKNNLYLALIIGRQLKSVASDGRVLCALATPPFLSSLHGMRPYDKAGRVAQTDAEKPSNYRGNQVKRTRTRRVCSRFLRTQDCPFYRRSLPRSLPQSVLPLTNPANTPSNPKPSRKRPFSEWNQPEPGANYGTYHAPSLCTFTQYVTRSKNDSPCLAKTAKKPFDISCL